MRPILLGNDANNQPVYLTPKEYRTHKHVIGGSGLGKSGHLEIDIRQLLHWEDGFTLIDKHGTLYDALVDYCAYHVIDREIVLLDLSQPQAIVGFNPFQRAAKGDVSVQVDQRITALLHAWNEKYPDRTPTLVRILRLVFTVMLELNLGLPQIQHLIDYNAEAVRESLIERIRSPLVRNEWRELQILKGKEWRDETMSARNRLFKFLGSETLCRFMGVPGRSINLREIMDRGAIVAVRLGTSGHLSEDNALAFGALLVNQYFEDAKLRDPDEFGNLPRPHRLIIDEFGGFVSFDIASMLDEIRKRSLFLTLSHQRLSQLNDDVLDAVLTNCRVKVVFGGLSSKNARLMAEELFLSEVNPKKVKAEIYQTKFRPEYARDRVYSKGSSHTATSARTRSTSKGRSSSRTSSRRFESAPTFLGMSETDSEVGSNMGISAGMSELSGVSDSDADAFGQTQSVADVPITLHVPFRELSSREHYTPEEQMIEFTARLMDQGVQQCHVKVLTKKPVAITIPNIARRFLLPESRRSYLQKLAAKQKALTAEQVDRLLQRDQQKLLAESRRREATRAMPVRAVKKPKETNAKQTAVAPLDKVMEDVIGRD